MNVTEIFIRYLFDKAETIDEKIIKVAEDCMMDNGLE